ncbi:MAG: 50S ribosomal protein L1 [Candidatus Latescibacterota bacterium]|nr:MAG: 50S ribosomal protein L1 [Candidatus Latescibacterota bacterium]RKY66949.1 MAG: 50S ribosomal protein L1 [Candidatus Latescibacterota bacterium]
MAQRGKRYREQLARIDRTREYSLEEAVRLLKDLPHANFDETVEMAMQLGVDTRRADQAVRGMVVLPYGTGKPVRVLVFAKGDAEKEALEAGADYVGADDLVQKIQEGWLDFDVAIATPDMMSMVGRLGRILGPRGLMPNPRTGTVTKEVGRAVREAKAGRVEFRADRGGNVHAPVGKLSFPEEHIVENCRAFVEAVLRARPATVKGPYVRSASISSTMSPGIRIDRASLGV